MCPPQSAQKIHLFEIDGPALSCAYAHPASDARQAMARAAVTLYRPSLTPFQLCRRRFYPYGRYKPRRGSVRKHELGSPSTEVRELHVAFWALRLPEG